jgi:hypothetical protein
MRDALNPMVKINTNAKVTSVEEDSLNIDSKSKVRFRKK